MSKRLTVAQHLRYDSIADAYYAREERAKAARAAARARSKGVDVRTGDLRSEGRRWIAWKDRGAVQEKIHSLKWNVAGRCTRPISVQRTVRGPSRRGTYSMLSEIEVRCRKCDACMAAKKREWVSRALKELTRVGIGRAWYGTLTFRPECRFILRTRARAKARQRVSGDFDAMDKNEKFRRLHRCAGALVTKYLKRLRKAGCRFRYMLVVEPHADDFPHYHMLIIEADPAGPIPHKLLREQWYNHSEGGGFCQWELVRDGRPAYYICKYLTKDWRARVRASQGFGETL